ncbi:MAG: adenylate/guanylate cyclase domain-containing protein, partial [Gemmatimonadota bacterium]|nr:adenylate/guanylate cyclase domain-containing protein [Gemmatimonadota bacterium]
DLFGPDAFASGPPDPKALGSRVRHDLRTPLNHVIGYAELLLEDATEAGEEAVARDLERIRSSARKILAMLDDALVALSGEADPLVPGANPPNQPALDPGLAAALDDLEEDPGVPSPLAGRVLVVDDDETNRDVLARRVRSQGAEVVAVGSGEEALEALRAGSFDAVLLDVVMPGMNGLQVLREMKRDTALRDVPVIMISALDEVESTVRCIRLGAEDYLSKPFNPTILRARLGASIEKKRMRDREVVHLRTIDEERKRSDELLHAIFPAEVVRELKTTRTVNPRRYEDVAVVFSDVVGFTPFAEVHEPEQVVDALQALVDRQEEIADDHGLEKIKTIGDAFMASAGMLRPTPEPVAASVRCGVEMIEVAGKLDPPWELRVGIHVGPLVGGVLGHRQYLFDLIGDTVNVAARVESAGEPGTVCLSGEAWQRVAHLCAGRSLGRVAVKGRQEMEIVRFERFL